MGNGVEARMEMHDSGAGGDRVVFLYGGGNETGLRAAAEFVDMGAQVVIANDSTTEATVRRRLGQTVDFLAVEPTERAAITRLAETFRSEYDCLDVFASTKAAAYDPSSQSEAGSDSTLVANHLAVYRLVYELHEMAASASTTRILLPVSPLAVQSSGHLVARPQGTSRRTAFLSSQRANAAFVASLAAATETRPVNAYDPGIGHFGDSSTPADGARRLAFVSTTPIAGGVSGIYYRGSPAPLEQEIDAIETAWHHPEQSVPDRYQLSVDEAVRTEMWAQSAQYWDIDPGWWP